MAVPVSDPSCAMVVLVRAGWLMSRMTSVWARGVSLAWRKVQYLRGVVPYSVCVTLHRDCLGLLNYVGNIGACMHHIQCNWYTSVWDACGLCYFAQVLPAVLLYCCGLAFLGLVAWSQFCGYRSAARLMKSRITRIRLLFSKQFDSETSFRSNLRSS